MCFFWNCDDDKAKPYVIGLLRPLIYNSKVIAEQLQIKRHGYCSSNWVVMKHPSIIEILIVSHSINNCSYN